ncbi:MAG: DNA polymerase III subunit gamma/tau, partial [Ruminococcaceae bacterium]|nr:DNA polymerase III subunit gamma/tau [Oscillospiraceae bacterium]
TFDDVYGQEHVTSILKYETENNKFSHAYLFCGSRGTGKTTCAKILAKAVNCTSPVNGSPCNKCAACLSIDAGTATDVLEMDAASNNGVDNIRDIRDEVVYTPSSLKYRVYIVDEVHMLSGSAFNALLKTLEEPPAHAIFILATTELHKLPSTIVSRCQRHDFRRIATDTLVSRLSHISDAEGIEYDGDALRIIAKMAQGGMRDAISLLELCAGSREKITAEIVNSTLGIGGRDFAENTVRAIAASDFDTVFGAVESVVSSAKDILVFWQDLVSFYRDMLVVKTTRSAKNYLDLTDDELQQLAKVASLFTKETLLYHCRVLDDTFYTMQKSGIAKRTVAEMALVKMCDTSLEVSTDSLLARISKLESAVAAGSFAVRTETVISAPNKEPKVKKAEEKDLAFEMPELKAEEKTEKTQTELKALRGWSEICDKAAADNGAVLGFLRMAKAFTDGTSVFVRFPNDFARSMVDKPSTKEALRVAICMSIQKNISAGELVFGIFEGDEDNISQLDEFNLD